MTNRLYDISGNGKHAITSGVSLNSGRGNGASVDLEYLSGDTSSTVLWPTGSIPNVFTICSITRYVISRTDDAILSGKSKLWFHGHYNSRRGEAFYGKYLTHDGGTQGTGTDWLVMCGKNGGLAPNNILIDGIAGGYYNGGTGGDDLSINLGRYAKSNWAFRELTIWNTALSDSDMVVMSTALRTSLLYGQV